LGQRAALHLDGESTEIVVQPGASGLAVQVLVAGQDGAVEKLPGIKGDVGDLFAAKSGQHVAPIRSGAIPTPIAGQRPWHRRRLYRPRQGISSARRLDA
jgi:hypothetical protein